MRLKDKVAIVTGASRGIGMAIVERFVSEGAIVIAGSKSNPVGVYPHQVFGVRLDVTNEANWSDLVKRVIDQHGRVDVLVNNAGIIVYDDIQDLSSDQWDSVISVNQKGVFFGMKHVVPSMISRAAGSIINISSIWGSAAVAGSHAYHASKGAVLMMSRNAAVSYAKKGVRVNSLLPGFIETPLTRAQDQAITETVVNSTPMGRPGQPFEIANGCLFLASDESSFMTGADLVIDGGYLAR